MCILDLREPNKVINNAIEIIEELKEIKTKELLAIKELNANGREIVANEEIIDSYLKMKQYQKLIKDLERVRDFASEQFKKEFFKKHVATVED